MQNITDLYQTFLKSLNFILSHGTIGMDLSIAYTSRLLNKAEQNYSIIGKALLAIVYNV